MAHDFFEFCTPTHVLFGPGMLSRLHELEMPGKKALLVISSGKSVRENGALERTIAELEAAGVEYVLFDKITANPTKEITEEGARVARREQCDFVVSLGGGSVMDAAKVMAMFAPQPSDDLWDYAKGSTGKKLPLTNPELPYIAITTTAGTGSEVDAGGVISKLETHEKIGVGSPHLFARYAIIDPELMTSVPPAFTAYQGFDALFHSTEGHISNNTNLMADMVQMAAISNIAAWLPEAVYHGENVEARAHVAFANTMSGYSMVYSGCTSEHALEHAMSAYHPELPHGAGLIMISVPYYSYWVKQHLCDERFIEMARAMGKPDAKDPEEFVEALEELQEKCGVAHLKMSDYGITFDEIPTLATCARATMYHVFDHDPADLSHDDVVKIYEEAWRRGENE